MDMLKEYHLGLIGFPIEHSLSPRLHRAALHACGLAGDYQLFPAADLPQGDHSLQAVIERLRDGSVDGVNITIPHKQNMMTLVDKLSTTAEITGAVNTIYKKNGVLWGENTDVAGFINDLARVGVEKSENQTAIVLGAGGAARAVVAGLLTEGWRVRILARRIEQAQQTADWVSRKLLGQDAMDANRVSASVLESQVLQHLSTSETIRLIVNTTPLGMASHPQGVAWPKEIPIPKTAIVYDLVYTPAETELIRMARRGEIPAFNGLGMLVEQAALAFEIWTGQRAPREAMWKAVEKL
jgi:shikimate dehydrogenase